MSELREAMARAMAVLSPQCQSREECASGGECIWPNLCYERTIDAALAAIEAAGFAVVPKEATEAMVEAGMAARKMAGRVSGAIGQTTDSSWRHEFRHEIYTWAAMLDAAPKP